MGIFWEHFTEIITDPAHTAVEFCFVLLDYLVIQVVGHRIKKHFQRDLKREHLRLDAEHGHTHSRVTQAQFITNLRRQAGEQDEADEPEEAIP